MVLMCVSIGLIILFAGVLDNFYKQLNGSTSIGDRGIKGTIAVAIIVPMFIAIYMGVTGIKLYESDIKNEIISVDTDKGISGSFVLGSGNIKSDAYYYVYEINPDSSKTLKSYLSSSIKVYEVLDSGQQAYSETDKILGIAINKRFYVPRDTITRQIDLDISQVK